MGFSEGTIEDEEIEAVDFSKCQMVEVVEAYQRGEKVDIEAVSPYLSDYNTHTGEMWRNLLTPADMTGIEIAKALKAAFPNARRVSLYDEYNSGFPDSTDAFGKPLRDAPQLQFSDEVKERFRDSFKTVLKDRGVLDDSDREGENYLLISESEKIRDAEELVGRLEQAGFICRDGAAIFFENVAAENPGYKKIPLRTKHGRWLCEALDAASFIKSENLAITHLVILPNHFKNQQDKVWEMLRVLGIKPTKYHNIFFDERMPTEQVISSIQEALISARGDGVKATAV